MNRILLVDTDEKFESGDDDKEKDPNIFDILVDCL